MKSICNAAKAGIIDNCFLRSMVLIFFNFFFLELIVTACVACVCSHVFVGGALLIISCSEISLLPSDKLILLS